jgi:hypothetical protein
VRLLDAGVPVVIAVHHHDEMIRAHFGDRQAPRVTVSYGR